MAKPPQSKLGLLVKALRSGELDLTIYLTQLEAHFTEREPEVQAFLPETNRFERLRRDAAALAEQFPDPADRPPLYGIPVGVKDMFHVDGFLTQAGSRVPPDILAGPEAESVRLLKAAGALILGKTVSTEFAYFAPGPTRNPVNPDHTPGGSSSGSAAAVGADLCPLALGTQTIGSIVRPAAFCGVVGYKPTYGRISAEGVIPLSPAVDHIGLFCRDVAGARLAARVLCDVWQTGAGRDTRPILGIPEGPYLEKTSVQGLAHFQAVQAHLVQAGVEVRSIPAMADFAEIYARHNTLVAAEAARVHQNWFADFSGLYHQKTIELIERGQQVTSDQMAEALAGREKLRRDLTKLMAEHNISVWISPPALGPAPVTLDSTGDPVMNLPWTHAGLPALNLPAGQSATGLPMGLQVVAGWGQDEQLLSWAGQLEQALQEE
ncbi:MAG: amidase [Anaerolineae bacterium]|nr:amidase [Anaerolineae bacterium]